MNAKGWFWLVFCGVVLLAICSRILRNRADERYSGLHIFLGKVGSFIGWLWLAVFFISMGYVFFIGFPE